MKQKRERDRNWTVQEKELLKNTIEPYLTIINSKCNNMGMIEKKREVWRRVATKLRLHGIEFQIPKLKQQWMRMKDQARLKARAQNNISRKETSFISNVHFNEDNNETYFKKEKSVSETSDVDVGISELRQPIFIQQPTTDWEKLSFEDQVFEKKLEKINIEIAHETQLFEIKKEIELKKLELIKLQIKKELENF